MPTVEIYRVRIDPEKVARLLEIRAAVVTEFQEEVPELLQADLVRLDEDTWLDVLRWSAPVDPERISAATQCAPSNTRGCTAHAQTDRPQPWPRAAATVSRAAVAGWLRGSCAQRTPPSCARSASTS